MPDLLGTGEMAKSKIMPALTEFSFWLGLGVGGENMATNKLMNRKDIRGVIRIGNIKPYCGSHQLAAAETKGGSPRWRGDKGRWSHGTADEVPRCWVWILLYGWKLPGDFNLSSDRLQKNI